MNILHIHTHTNLGGAAKVAKNLHLKLPQYGITSKLYAGRGIADISNNIEVLGIYQWQFVANALIYRLSSIEAPLNVDRWFKVLPALLDWADVIHIHNVHGYYMPTLVLEKILEKPVVWTLHDEWIMTGRCTFSGNCQRYKQGCYFCPHLDIYPSTLVDRARHDFITRHRLVTTSKAILVSPSNILRQKLIDAGFCAERIQVIPNPTEFQESYNLKERQIIKEELKLPHNKIIILFVANVISYDRKGFDILEAALHKLTNPEKFLLIVIGKYNEKIQKKLNNLPIQFRLMGTIDSRTEIKRYYASSDVLVVPSREESFGLVTTEALSQGCQVICSDIPVFREVTDGKAIFFPVGDAQELALKLNDFYNQKENYQVSDLFIKKIREKFSFETVVNAYIKQYHAAKANNF
ncbi:glycosyltransferase [Nodularia spumigena]|jgi:glycosyltransferase involved in cell wall biosynthesis|uniref:glycosyltransferase n=1 Tax=Nodularia spumigena TaxID=70799 RepID=UPI002B1F7D72|nr:glycosyltransferase [Nodularia spumigena]MEA5557808.1 glycosyltransferase [Nodularia spumigena CH309]